MERTKPLAHVLGDDFMQVQDNVRDYSGMVVHPKESESYGVYMAPLTHASEDPKALATRIHEYTHLHLITAGLQPLGLHDAFEGAVISGEILQAMADAKVMGYCQDKGLSLKDLVVITRTDEEAIARIRHASRLKQANLFLRAIGTDLFPFVDKAVTISAKKKTFLQNAFARIKQVRTLEEWVEQGLAIQREFDTPTLRHKRETQMQDGPSAPSEGGDSSSEGSSSEESEQEEKARADGKDQDETGKDEGEEAKKERKPSRKERREQKKKEREKAKAKDDAFIKKLTEKYKPKPSAPKGEPKPIEKREKPEVEEVEDEPREEKPEKAKPLSVYAEEKKPDSPAEAMAKELMDFAGELDEGVCREASSTLPQLVAAINRDITESGEMEIIRPRLEKPFEPKERARKLKRSFVGALRFPQRLVSDSAVFGSKLRGKGGTLVIDCSGSMGITYEDIKKVLEQRPFATIAIYAGRNYNRSGGLAILVDKGKCVTAEQLQDVMMRFYAGNVVDVPALQWLAKRSGEKFWICDGGVTGEGDKPSFKLRVEAALIEKKHRIKRWSSLNAFLRNARPANA